MSASIPGIGPADPVRLALLWLDSDLPADPEIHHRGASAAFRRLDVPLSERLAEAAIRAGAGIESRILRANALSLLGRGEEAEELLAALPEADSPDEIWAAAGHPNGVFRLSPQQLVALTGAPVEDVTVA